MYLKLYWGYESDKRRIRKRIRESEKRNEFLEKRKYFFKDTIEADP